MSTQSSFFKISVQDRDENTIFKCSTHLNQMWNDNIVPAYNVAVRAITKNYSKDRQKQSIKDYHDKATDFTTTIDNMSNNIMRRGGMIGINFYQFISKYQDATQQAIIEDLAAMYSKSNSSEITILLESLSPKTQKFNLS